MPKVNKPRAGADSEKITVNLGFVDLGKTDVLVREGFYASRADFIRTAIRNQLDREESAAKATATREDLLLGIHHYTREQLEAAETAGQMIDIKVLGLAKHRQRCVATIGSGNDQIAEGAGGFSRAASSQTGIGQSHVLSFRYFFHRISKGQAHGSHIIQ